MEDSSGCGEYLISAELTGVGFTACPAIVISDFLASLTENLIVITSVKNKFKALIIIGKLFIELFNRVSGGFHLIKISSITPCYRNVITSIRPNSLGMRHIGSLPTTRAFHFGVRATIQTSVASTTLSYLIHIHSACSAFKDFHFESPSLLKFQKYITIWFIHWISFFFKAKCKSYEKFLAHFPTITRFHISIATFTISKFTIRVFALSNTSPKVLIIMYFHLAPLYNVTIRAIHFPVFLAEPTSFNHLASFRILDVTKFKFFIIVLVFSVPAIATLCHYFYLPYLLFTFIINHYLLVVKGYTTSELSQYHKDFIKKGYWVWRDTYLALYVPSSVAFGNAQAYKHENPIKTDLEKMDKKLDEVIKLLDKEKHD